MDEDIKNWNLRGPSQPEQPFRLPITLPCYPPGYHGRERTDWTDRKNHDLHINLIFQDTCDVFHYLHFRDRRGSLFFYHIALYSVSSTS